MSTRSMYQYHEKLESIGNNSSNSCYTYLQVYIVMSHGPTFCLLLQIPHHYIFRSDALYKVIPLGILARDISIKWCCCFSARCSRPSKDSYSSISFEAASRYETATFPIEKNRLILFPSKMNNSWQMQLPRERHSQYLIINIMVGVRLRKQHANKAINR